MMRQGESAPPLSPARPPFRLAAGLVLSSIIATGLGWRSVGGQSSPRNASGEVVANLRFLASDELRGRRSGTPEERIAARFIAERLRAYGVTPPPGQSDYLQEVPLVEVQPAERVSLQLPGDVEFSSRDVLSLNGPGQLQGPLVDAGHGLPDQDDSADWTGKVVVTRFGTPSGGFGPGLLARKRGEAVRRGAVALIEFYRGNRWTRLRQFLSRPRTELASEGSRIPHLIVRIASDEGSAESVPSQGNAKLSIVGPDPRQFQSANVIGRIAGTEAELDGQHLLVSAHYDHVGVREAGPGEDSIFNGARDNAMGVVAMLRTAQYLAHRPARRPVLLVAYTAEESGLLGSRFFASAPVVPLPRIVFNLNSDGGIFDDPGAITAIGLERSDVAGALAPVARRMDLELIPPPPGQEALFQRSDNYSLARLGIPGITVSAGFREMGGESMRFYHNVTDQADEHFDFHYLTRFAETFARFAETLANLPSTPGWAPGDPLAETARSLYRPGG